ncbi:hypothetical protein CHI10_15430 [Bacillus sp. 7894-2]|nr:hypothetical protein CHI10_15430 [Bacillus sp. 7894-2]
MLGDSKENQSSCSSRRKVKSLFPQIEIVPRGNLGDTPDDNCEAMFVLKSAMENNQLILTMSVFCAQAYIIVLTFLKIRLFKNKHFITLI